MRHAFAAAWPALVSACRSGNAPRVRGIEFHPARAGYLLQITLSAPHKLQVSRRFTRALSREFRTHWHVLQRACLPDSTSRVRSRLWPYVAESIVHLSTSFVVCHELFHVLNGHVAAVRATTRGKTRQLAFVEAAHLALTTQRGHGAGRDASATGQRMLEAYYYELEADNTALQWVMQESPLSPMLRAVAELTDARAVVAADISALPDGWGRVLAFRALISALVLTVRLLERQRGRMRQEPDASHPYPMARLFAGVFTVLEQFAEITEFALEPDGGKVARLTTRGAKDVKTFLGMVMKPVVAAPWASPDAASSDGFTFHGPLIAVEIGNILQGRPPATEPVRQMLRVQGLRHRMTRRLRAHRHIARPNSSQRRT